MSVIGAMRVILGIDTAAYESGLRRAEGRTRQAQRSIVGTFAAMRTAAAGLAGVIGVGLLADQARQAFEYAASLNEAARAIGLTAEQYQILNRAAVENGFTMESASRAMSILNRRLGEAQGGNQRAIEMFRQLNITPEQIRSYQQGGDAIGDLFEGLSRVETGAQRAAAQQFFLGRSSAELTSLIVQGRRGWEEYSRAAREAGLITDEQARRADEAADELAVLGLTLRTNLASALVDIIPLIQNVTWLLGQMASIAGSAIRIIGSIPVPTLGGFGPGAARGLLQAIPLYGAIANLATTPSGRGRRRGGGLYDPYAASPWGRGGAGGGTHLDLTGGGGGGGRRRAGGGGGDAARAAERAIREEAQFQDEMRRQRLDVLRETERQATDIVAQTDVRRQIADLEREEYAARVALDVRLGERTQAQADALLAAYDEADALRRRGMIVEEQNRAEEERRDLADADHEIAAERLRLEADAATTAGERRQAELRLLDLTTQHEIAKREAISEERHGVAAAEQARREIAGIRENFGRQRDQVMRNTRGPLETFLAELPTSAARANEALQAVAVDGLRSLTDGLADAITGARSLADAFSQMAKSIIADLLRIVIQQRIIAPLAQLLGLGGGGLVPKVAGAFAGAGATGIKGFASGGSFRVGGMAGVDRNLLSINGVPAARVSAGERVAVSPAGAGGVTVVQHFSIDAGDAATKGDVLQLATMVKPLAREAYAEMARRRA